jgi:hypothetical protein
MSVCGECLYRYKHVKDFCPSCFKPYATDDSMLPLHGPVVVVPDAHVEVVTESDKSEKISPDSEAWHENGGGLKTEPMEVDATEPPKEDASHSDAAAAPLDGADEPSTAVAGSEAPGTTKPDELAIAAVENKDPYDFMSEDNMVRSPYYYLPPFPFDSGSMRSIFTTALIASAGGVQRMLPVGARKL